MGVNNALPARGAVEDQANSLQLSVNALDPTYSDLFEPLLPDFTSLDFGDGLFASMETRSISPLATPESESYSTPATTQTNNSLGEMGENTYPDSASIPPVNAKGQDCFREAYDIMGSLSFRSLKNVHSRTESQRPGQASTTASTANQVPLDHVLRLNREASERLMRLLTCHCTEFPQLIMLYATIISQILTWYQQAAGFADKPPWSPTATTQDAALHCMSLTNLSPSSCARSMRDSSPWSSTAADSFGAADAKFTRPLSYYTEVEVVPTRMAIGGFNVDDHRVQTALEIQLLSGEIRRVGRLIDQFTAHNSRQCLSNERILGGVNNLYQSLDSWLRGDYSRIVNMMRSKLRELNS